MADSPNVVTSQHVLDVGRWMKRRRQDALDMGGREFALRAGSFAGRKLDWRTELYPIEQGWLMPTYEFARPLAEALKLTIRDFLFEDKSHWHRLDERLRWDWSFPDDDESMGPRDGLLFWLSCGLTPDQARLWTTAGWDLLAASCWAAANLEPDDSMAWFSGGLNLSDRQQLLGSCSPEVAAAWRREGPADALTSGWMQEGFSIRDAGEWTRAGFDCWAAVEWRDLGVSPLLAVGFRDAQIAKARVSKWKLNGWPITRIREWASEFRLQDALWAHRRELSIRTLRRLVDRSDLSGCVDPVLRERVDLWLADSWDVDQALDWLRAEVDPETSGEWRALGLRPEEVRRLLERGVSSQAAEHWISVGVPAAHILAWVEFGFTPDRAAAWTFVDPWRAMRAEQRGLSPELLRERIRNGDRLVTEAEARRRVPVIHLEASLMRTITGPLRNALRTTSARSTLDTCPKCFEYPSVSGQCSCC